MTNIMQSVRQHTLKFFYFKFNYCFVTVSTRANIPKPINHRETLTCIIKSKREKLLKNLI